MQVLWKMHLQCLRNRLSVCPYIACAKTGKNCADFLLNMVLRYALTLPLNLFFLYFQMLITKKIHLYRITFYINRESYTSASKMGCSSTRKSRATNVPKIEDIAVIFFWIWAMRYALTLPVTLFLVLKLCFIF